MPNHIINNVKISGNAEDVKKCFETIVKPLEVEDYEGNVSVETRFSFEHIIPMPKSLSNDKDLYYWCIENWGTKWDAYGVYCEYGGGSELGLFFRTAWSTPKPIFDKLAEMFPELTITIDFADENWGSNCGTITYENGKMTSWVDEDINFAMGLWGYSPEEIKEKVQEWEEWEKENEED